MSDSFFNSLFYFSLSLPQIKDTDSEEEMQVNFFFKFQVTIIKEGCCSNFNIWCYRLE